MHIGRPGIARPFRRKIAVLRLLLLLLGLSTFVAAQSTTKTHDSKLARILQVIEQRERATVPFCATYYETGSYVGDRRMGPNFYAWSPERSFYRGPKLGSSVPIIGWFTGDRVERESIYFRDQSQAIWIHQEDEPISLPWNGTRGGSAGPDARPETGLFFWDGRPLSAFLRARAVTVAGHETLHGDPCVKLRVGGPMPRLLWLSTKHGYFPRRSVETWGPQESMQFHHVEWTNLRRHGDMWYPLHIRIEWVGFERDPVQELEVVEESVRFGDDVTDADFALPGLYFLDDSLSGGYVAVTPFGRITLALGLVVTASALILLLLGLVRTRVRFKKLRVTASEKPTFPRV